MNSDEDSMGREQQHFRAVERAMQVHQEAQHRQAYREPQHRQVNQEDQNRLVHSLQNKVPGAHTHAGQRWFSV